MRNNLDLEQLEMEKVSMADLLEHELKVLSGGIIRAELERERFLALGKENEEVLEAIKKIDNDLSVENLAHVEEMHRMNRDLQKERMKMEKEFRDQLTRMDVNFQNEAFLKLDDDRKQAMLANSKLKDELGLLTVGLSALDVRYKRDTHAVRNTKFHVEELERKGRLLKRAVKTLAKIKVNRAEMIEKINHDIDLFTEKKKEVDLVLHSAPFVSDIACQLQEVDAALQLENRNIDMWRERERLLKLLRKEFKAQSHTHTGIPRWLIDFYPLVMEVICFCF